MNHKKPANEQNVHNIKEFIASMKKPDWDSFFMGMVYYYSLLSPDQETKVGCIIIDTETKVPIGFGVNGHPRGMDGLPTTRAEGKYNYMIHAEVNAMVNATIQRCDHATMYLPFPNCEVCLLNWLNHPFIKVKRIVIWKNRAFPKTADLYERRPDIKVDLWEELSTHKKMDNPVDLLNNAAMYMDAHRQYIDELSGDSARSYTKEIK